MITLCEKYRANCFKEIKGQDFAIDKLKSFIKNFGIGKKRAVILFGPSGTGKTALAYALASETDAEIVELNASELRNREKVNEIIGEASKQKSLFSNKKILLVDEIDGISTTDRGGLGEIIAITEKSAFPVIITANNIWDHKFSLLRNKAELVQLKEVSPSIIFSITQKIANKEKINVSDDMLKRISFNVRGDVRAAINDLQAIANGDEDAVDERNKEQDIFRVLQKLFKERFDNSMFDLFDSLNMGLDEVFLWIEENIPEEYKGEELFNAFEAMSIADVFRGRIHRQQHWRFLVYENILLSGGISASKKSIKLGFTKYKRPERILKIWLAKRKNEKKTSISMKFAKITHSSKKRTMKNFFLLPFIIDETAVKRMRLSEEEIEFLKERKNELLERLC
jgi:replication factor C large subunit